MKFSRVLILAFLVTTLGIIGIGTPHGVSGASSRQAVVPTVNPATLSSQTLSLPSWALPPTSQTVDSVALDTDYCVPDTSDDISDEFLLVHQDWCQGLGDDTGLFESFYLDQASPSSYVGEWAASVYDTAQKAQTVASGITSYLTNDGDVDGSCGSSPESSVKVLHR